MSPYTGTAKVIAGFLNGKDSKVSKFLSGPIESVKVLEKKRLPDDKNGNFEEQYKIEVITSRIDSGIKNNPPDFPACTGLFEVKVEWNFMELKNMEIRELSVECKKN